MARVKFFDLSREIQEDVRGFSFYPLKGRILDPSHLPASFHLVSIAPHQTRGNHAHLTKGEWLYPFHGQGYFLWEPKPGDLRERLISGHRLLIYIPPGIPHALRNPGPEPIYLLAWREGEQEGPDDTIPYPLG